MRSRDIETKYDVMYVPIIYYDTKIHRFLRIRLGPLPSPLDVILTHLSLSQRGRSMYRYIGRRTGQCPQDWDNNVIHSRPDTRHPRRLSPLHRQTAPNRTTTRQHTLFPPSQNQIKIKSKSSQVLTSSRWVKKEIQVPL